MSDLDLVVCRWRENVFWSDEFDFRYLIQKGAEGSGRRWAGVPDIGLESYAWLTYLIRRYDDLPAHAVFLQGHPFDHYANALFAVRYLDRLAPADRPIFGWLADWVMPTGRGPHADAPLRAHWSYPGWDETVESVVPEAPSYWSFGAGAQFVVAREQVHKRPLSFYTDLAARFEEESSENSHLSYHVERLWGVIFHAVGDRQASRDG